MLRRGQNGNTELPLTFERRMAVVYRAEKKKILRSQIVTIKKVLQVLKKAEEVLLDTEDPTPGRSFQELILAETLSEKDLREAAENDQYLTEE